jgi:hypothetical protein
MVLVLPADFREPALAFYISGGDTRRATLTRTENPGIAQFKPNREICRYKKWEMM